MSVLTASPNSGKVAWRDALIKEVCWLTGSNAEARISTTMRKKPSQFFEMWERLRGKAQKMIATKKNDTHAQTLLTMEEEAEEKLEPGLTEASGPSASSSNDGKFMLASLLVNDKIAKSKRIPKPLSLSSLKTTAISTFDLPEDSDVAFEVLDAATQDVWQQCVLKCVYRHGLVVLSLCVCFWFVWF